MASGFIGGSVRFFEDCLFVRFLAHNLLLAHREGRRERKRAVSDMLGHLRRGKPIVEDGIDMIQQSCDSTVAIQQDTIQQDTIQQTRFNRHDSTRHDSTNTIQQEELAPSSLVSPWHQV